MQNKCITRSIPPHTQKLGRVPSWLVRTSRAAVGTTMGQPAWMLLLRDSERVHALTSECLHAREARSHLHKGTCAEMFPVAWSIIPEKWKESREGRGPVSYGTAPSPRTAKMGQRRASAACQVQDDPLQQARGTPKPSHVSLMEIYPCTQAWASQLDGLNHNARRRAPIATLWENL